MKYKKLFGGDDPLQPIKTNSLPEVSAMDSAKGTLNSLTSFYKKIILNYLKNYKLITHNRVTNIKFLIKSMNNFIKLI